MVCATSENAANAVIVNLELVSPDLHRIYSKALNKDSTDRRNRNSIGRLKETSRDSKKSLGLHSKQISRLKGLAHRRNQYRKLIYHNNQ